ncbi:RelB-like antitoxin [Mycobacterium phage Paito]|uniref:RelB-like antitoxin n=1 Tax=Mycobacterium phage Paito TaxID=2315544 RepID=A0A386KH48_9CAUD|nr:antitoxin from a toxin-antitoxin system [Mycobacterium phage Paito]AYD84640.1 RelB-like antitoxin [Mycobacterium phage Paito]
MSVMIPISKAKARLSELVRQAADEDVLLMNHSTPAAVLISAERYDDMLEELEDLRDRISVHERSGVTISADKLVAELGLEL